MNNFPTNQITRVSSWRVLLFLSSASMLILCLLHNSCLYSDMNITTGIHAAEVNLFPISAPQIPSQLHRLGEAAWQTSRTAPDQGSQKQLWAAGGAGHKSAPAAPAPKADGRKHPPPEQMLAGLLLCRAAWRGVPAIQTKMAHKPGGAYPRTAESHYWTSKNT